jgi:hypothetical protein
LTGRLLPAAVKLSGIKAKDFFMNIAILSCYVKGAFINGEGRFDGENADLTFGCLTRAIAKVTEAGARTKEALFKLRSHTPVYEAALEQKESPRRTAIIQKHVALACSYYAHLNVFKVLSSYSLERSSQLDGLMPALLGQVRQQWANNQLWSTLRNNAVLCADVIESLPAMLEKLDCECQFADAQLKLANGRYMHNLWSLIFNGGSDAHFGEPLDIPYLQIDEYDIETVTPNLDSVIASLDTATMKYRELSQLYLAERSRTFNLDQGRGFAWIKAGNPVEQRQPQAEKDRQMRNYGFVSHALERARLDLSEVIGQSLKSLVQPNTRSHCSPFGAPAEVTAALRGNLLAVRCRIAAAAALLRDKRPEASSNGQSTAAVEGNVLHAIEDRYAGICARSC